MINARNQRRTGTSFEVTFPEFATFKQVPQWVRLTQSQGKQDVVEIAYAAFDKHFQKAFKTGVTIKLTWRTEFASGTWVGYVYSNADVTQSTIKRNVVIRGLGGSFPLKESGNKVWKNKTAPEIVTEICKKYNLKPVVDTSNVRFSMQSLVNGMTYWEKIQELAERIGFHVYVNNTTLYFQRIDKLIDQFSSVIPVMSHDQPNTNADSFTYSQTLDHFTATLGGISEQDSHKKSTKTVQGIDPVTGRSHSQTANPAGVGKNLRSNVSEPLFKETTSTVIAETQGIARELAAGLAHLARFSMRGKGVGQGDPRISPYKTIEVNGTGVETDGFWVVKNVEHYMTFDGRYSVTFECMTDGAGKNKGGIYRKSAATVVPTRDVAYEMVTGGKQAPSTPTLSVKQPLIVQTGGGYRSTRTRWVGK